MTCSTSSTLPPARTFAEIEDTRKSAYRPVIDSLLALFGGSARPVVAHLLDTGKLTLEDLKATVQTIVQRLEQKGAVRRTEPVLTPFELEVMDVLWQLREASVRQICDAISEKRRPAYTIDGLLSPPRPLPRS